MIGEKFIFNNRIALGVHGNSNIHKILSWHGQEVEIVKESEGTVTLRNKNDENVIILSKNLILPLVGKPSSVIKAGDICKIDKENLEKYQGKGCPLCGAHVSTSFSLYHADTVSISDVYRDRDSGAYKCGIKGHFSSLCHHFLHKVHIEYRG